MQTLQFQRGRSGALFSCLQCLQTEHQSLFSHAPLSLPDPPHDPLAFTEIMLGVDWIDDLEAQAFITDLKQKRSKLLINQPLTLHLSGVLSYQGGNKETRLETRQDKDSEAGITCTSLASQPYFSLFPVGGARGREKYVWTLWPASRATKECNNYFRSCARYAN